MADIQATMFDSDSEEPEKEQELPLDPVCLDQGGDGQLPNFGSPLLPNQSKSQEVINPHKRKTAGPDNSFV